MLKRFYSVVVGAAIISTSAFAFANGESVNTKVRKKRSDAPVDIKVVAVGPTEEHVNEIKAVVTRSEAVQKQLRGTNYRLLSFDYVEGNDKENKGAFNPQQFTITFYDYTNNRAIVAQGNFADPENPLVSEDARVPLPSEEELEIAQDIIRRSEDFASVIKGQKLRTFAAMPPTTIGENGERLINIGLESLDSSIGNEIVGVSLKRSEVVRYPNNAPPIAASTAAACGIPAAGCSGAGCSSGTTGQYQMTVSQNGTTLWEFLVIRPRASSGTNASGIELRDVKYRGKTVFKRAHAPVLNVNYIGDVCGPYRDWQDEEGGFQAPEAGAQNPAPGIRVLAPGQIATTALDTGNDAGNFRGVAIYTQNNETVLVSEMNAGWYRYIMEWRLANDGTIKPRYGFGATNNSCVCSIHTHHVYWRFDFDVVNSNNKIYQVERGRRFLTPIETERKVTRNYATNRSLLVQNGAGDEAYLVAPNISDGVTDTYGRGDFWILKYKNVPGGSPLQNEIDDGFGGLEDTLGIRIDPFVNGESVSNEDLVVWYGSHFIHADGANLLDPDRSGLILSGAHVVGPEIRPIRW